MFAFTADDRWVPGIGDPTLVGWVTVVAYFVTAGLCWMSARAWAKAAPGWSRPRLFWLLFTVALVLLGFNKQLDLQTWLTLFGKHLAENEGWYGQRRAVQAAFIAAVALGGCASLAGVFRLAGVLTRWNRIALIGGCMLGCFILIRASSFHHVDQMLGMNFQGIKVNWLLELGSISIIAWAALGEWRSRQTLAHCRRQALPGPA